MILNIFKSGILFTIIICKFASTEAKDYFLFDTNRIKIIEMPLRYTKEREQLSLAYLKSRYGMVQNHPTINPIMIVLHYTAGGTIKSTYNYFNNEKIETARVFNKKESELNVSSHYLIDRDGTIYHLIPDTLFARHIIGLNYCSIGIENIGSIDNPLTEKQVRANAELIKILVKKFPIKYLIGHSEYSRFRKSKLWKEKDQKYFTGKSDPGDKFLTDVRKLLIDLTLLNKPR
jgi:N-acetyl-anhydromuramyl-L-alanine amidase AmpD